MNFREETLKKMSAYAQKYGIGNGWSRRYKKYYSHILSVEHINGVISHENQTEVILRQNVLPSAKGKILMPADKWHKDAHHLNSSQVMCYNLFRPMLNDDGNLNLRGEEFVKNILGCCIDRNAAMGCFEYEDNSPEWLMDTRGKATNFDFHIADHVIDIYFEVKYTEQDFGSATHSNTDKYNFYKAKIKEVLGIDVTTEELKEYYQLYRNVIRISQTGYSVFLFPSNNKEVADQFSTFMEHLVNKKAQNMDHIKVVYLEDCCSYLEADFIEKYL